MTRETGIGLVEKYDGCCAPNYIESFSEYIGVSVDGFWDQVHRSVNRDLFQVGNDGTITRRFTVGVGL